MGKLRKIILKMQFLCIFYAILDIICFKVFGKQQVYNRLKFISYGEAKIEQKENWEAENYDFKSVIAPTKLDSRPIQVWIISN